MNWQLAIYTLIFWLEVSRVYIE